MIDRAEEERLHTAICEALLESIPEHWTTAKLEIWRESATSDDLLHSISSPEGYPPVMPVDDLYPHTITLDMLLDGGGGRLRHATFTITHSGGTD